MNELRGLILSGRLRGVKPRAWVVLSAWIAEAPTGRPKLAVLAAVTGYDLATVKRALRELRAAGLLPIEAHGCARRAGGVVVRR